MVAVKKEARLKLPVALHSESMPPKLKPEPYVFLKILE
jgi:hypothetical protein